MQEERRKTQEERRKNKIIVLQKVHFQIENYPIYVHYACNTTPTSYFFGKPLEALAIQKKGKVAQTTISITKE
jgi:hypothetical protein